MKEKNRDYFLDNLKVILIFLVVFGHVIEFYINESVFLKSLYIFIYLFHMPVFVFVSGYFSKNEKGVRRGAFKNLLIPYIVFDIIWYTTACLVTRENIFSFIYPGWTLWYLISLFFWRISLKYLLRIKGIIPISIVAGLLIGFLDKGLGVLAFSRTIVFLPFFLMGYLFKGKDLKRIFRINKAISIIGLCSFFVVSVYIASNDLIKYSFLYNNEAYSAYGLTNMEGILVRGCLYSVSILLGIFLINITPNKKVFFSYIGKNTMNIYVFHIYLVIGTFLIIKTWDRGVVFRLLLLVSPVIITYILSFKVFTGIYNVIFYPINKVNKHIVREVQKQLW